VRCERTMCERKETAMNILVINCGSSSLKYQLINSESEEVLAKGLCERIGIDGQLTYQPENGKKETSDIAMPTHTEAINAVIRALTNEATGVIKSLSEVGAVGHRVVHGGEKFTSSCLINEASIKAIEECNDLAPLHNPANLIGIRACEELMPGVPMVAVFDTAFHQTMPEVAYIYGLPYEYYEKYKVRRYGFHGTSHSYVSKRVAEITGKPYDQMKIIVKDMLKKDSAILIGMDYSISLKHAIKPRAFLIKERNKLDSVAWAIEYENQMIAENAHAYFTYEMLNKNRCLKRPFYPRKNEDVLMRARNLYAIPRQQGEIRIISCDIATEGGDSNDNSIFSCIRALPESMEYKTSDVNGEHIEVKQGYRRQVVYMEPQTEFETTKQAIRIKQLFTDFDADYCVLDTRNAGIAIYDALAKVLYDVERNVEYEPWSCMNDDNLRSRIVIAGQKEVVYSIKAQLETNSKIAVCMKNTLNSKMIELMVPNQEGVEELQRIVPDYETADVETQLFYERPFLETVALINEMIGLEYTVQNQTGLIKIEERSGARKDRYTSVSYGNYFIELLEQDLFSDSSEYEYVTFYN